MRAILYFLVGILLRSEAYSFNHLFFKTPLNLPTETQFSKPSYHVSTKILSNSETKSGYSDNQLDNNAISNKVQSFLELLKISLNSKHFVSISLQPNTNHADYENQADLLFKNSKYKLNIHNLKSLNGRLILIKNDIKCQFMYRYKTNDQVKNYDIKKEFVEVLIELFCYQHLFKKAVLTTSQESVELIFSNVKGNEKIKTNTINKKLASPAVDVNDSHISLDDNSKINKNEDNKEDDDIVDYYYNTNSNNNNITPTSSSSFPYLIPTSHNRQKQSPIPSTAPFLRALKVTVDDTSGTPRSGMADKLKQIQKFVEIMEGLIDTARDDDNRSASFSSSSSKSNSIINTIGNASNVGNSDLDNLGNKSITVTPANTASINKIRIIDVGCGMGYLTFAVHSHFSQLYHNNQNKNDNITVETTGVEIRGKLVQQTNAIAVDLGKHFERLKFIKGDIASFQLDQVLQAHTSNTNDDSNTDNDDNNADSNSPVDTNLDSSSSSSQIKVRKHDSESDHSTTSLSSSSSSSSSLLVFMALHACDTATDEAIWHGIKSSADVIVLSPCCQKQVRKQIDDTFKKLKQQINNNNKSNKFDFLLIDNDDVYDVDNIDDYDNDEELDISILNNANVFASKRAIQQLQQQKDYALLSLLESGIHRERLSELLTDKIRALLLQLAGYQTQIFEFVDSEHTSKNTMISSVKDKKHNNRHYKSESNSTADQQNQQQYQKRDDKKTKEIKLKLNSLIDMFGITQHRLIDLFLDDSSSGANNNATSNTDNGNNIEYSSSSGSNAAAISTATSYKHLQPSDIPTYNAVNIGRDVKVISNNSNTKNKEISLNSSGSATDTSSELTDKLRRIKKLMK